MFIFLSQWNRNTYHAYLKRIQKIIKIIISYLAQMYNTINKTLSYSKVIL